MELKFGSPEYWQGKALDVDVRLPVKVYREKVALYLKFKKEAELELSKAQDADGTGGTK